LKVAVYSISKNEEQFINRWVESAKDADMILLADTGSTDNTVQLAKTAGASVVEFEVSPWRFDTARNKSLEAIPEDYDYCIALDCDEVLLPGWREGLERAHKAGITRPRYKYVWSWNDDGTEGLTYGGDKIHARKNYVWKHPVHEVMSCTSVEKQDWFNEIEIHHHPDSSKPRSQYLPLLELSVKEDPNDDRNAHYYARELLMYGHKEQAYKEFERHLALPTATWKAERANSYRYMSMCVEDNALKEELLFKTVAEYPHGREGWVTLGQHYYLKEDWHGCYFAINRALEITEKPLVYFNEAWAWNEYPYDIGSLAAFYLGQDKDAISWCEKAIDLAPDNARLKNNLLQFKEVTNGNK
jgi:glycosyltransferase involved in cell wall biosynthesis